MVLVFSIQVQEKPPPSDDSDDDDEGWTPDAVAITPDAKRVLTVSVMDNNLHVFDVQTGDRYALIKGKTVFRLHDVSVRMM